VISVVNLALVTTLEAAETKITKVKRRNQSNLAKSLNLRLRLLSRNVPPRRYYFSRSYQADDDEFGEDFDDEADKIADDNVTEDSSRKERPASKSTKPAGSRASKRSKTSSAKSEEVVEDEDEDQLFSFHILLCSLSVFPQNLYLFAYFVTFLIWRIYSNNLSTSNMSRVFSTISSLIIMMANPASLLFSLLPTPIF
jgi:hypothetical protein